MAPRGQKHYWQEVLRLPARFSTIIQVSTLTNPLFHHSLTFGLLTRAEPAHSTRLRKHRTESHPIRVICNNIRIVDVYSLVLVGIATRRPQQIPSLFASVGTDTSPDSKWDDASRSFAVEDVEGSATLASLGDTVNVARNDGMQQLPCLDSNEVDLLTPRLQAMLGVTKGKVGGCSRSF